LRVVVTEYWDLRREVLVALASSTEKLPPRPCTHTHIQPVLRIRIQDPGSGFGSRPWI
jgi:hypothetical protein